MSEPTTTLRTWVDAACNAALNMIFPEEKRKVEKRLRKYIQRWYAEGLLDATTQEGPTEEQKMTLMRILKLRNTTARGKQKGKGWFSFSSVDVDRTSKAIMVARFLLHSMALTEAAFAPLTHQHIQ